MFKFSCYLVHFDLYPKLILSSGPIIYSTCASEAHILLACTVATSSTTDGNAEVFPLVMAYERMTAGASKSSAGVGR